MSEARITRPRTTSIGDEDRRAMHWSQLLLPSMVYARFAVDSAYPSRANREFGPRDGRPRTRE